jgi:hypothetical protein
MADLAQLKAENAAREAELAASPQDDVEELDDAVTDEQDATGQDADQDQDAEGAKADAEDWMKGDEPESQGAGKKFTDGDIGAAKSKLRAKLEAKHQTELDELRAKLEAAQKQQVPQATARPTREQFYDQDDPDDAYAEALMDWKMGATAAQQQVSRTQYEQQRKQLEHKQATDQAVDQHYERAVKLAAASGIEPEVYQSADHRVRSAIEGLFPNGGDAVTDSLISAIGEGSERVMFNLGVNSARLSELKTLLASDPSGIKASMFLGRLSAELNAPAKRKSNAPAPAAQVKGDAATTESGRAIHKKYQDAHKAGKVGEAFSLKRQAKASGVNTLTW